MRWRFRPAPDSLLGRFHARSYLLRMGIGQALWLAMLFVVPLQARGFAWSWLLPTALSALVYLYLHVQVYAGPMRRLAWYAGGMALLGLALWPLNSVAFGYLVCAGIALSLSPSYRVWLAGMAVIAAAALPVALWLHAPLWVMLVVLVAGVLGGSSNFLYVRNLYKDAELRLSRDELRRLAVLAERERIGRDLHDLLGHTLSLVTLKSELARRLALADPPRAQREMEEVERVARHALAEVRAAVTGLRRSDLTAELASARLMLEASGVDFDGALPADVEVPEAVEATLALVLREAVTNIHRHAKASAARVRFEIDEESFRMTVSDNGRGGLAAHGNGVSGMRERVRALGGELRIDSPPRRGTTIAVEVPLRGAPASAVAAAPTVAGSAA
jgi:two-component system sensor histidine kinase DesK